VTLYRQLAKRGVHEYIPLPADPAHLVDAVLTICTDPEEARQARLISFIGASGGAGSTTVANNVAWRLGKQHDGEVALVDLDPRLRAPSARFQSRIAADLGSRTGAGRPSRRTDARALSGQAQREPRPTH